MVVGRHPGIKQRFADRLPFDQEPIKSAGKLSGALVKDWAEAPEIVNSAARNEESREANSPGLLSTDLSKPVSHALLKTIGAPTASEIISPGIITPSWNCNPERSGRPGS